MAKSVLSEDMLVTHVQCKIFTKVISKEKLFAPKFDYFYKHVGTKKIISPMPSVPKNTLYYVKDCQHVKNEVFYVSKNGENVLDMVMQGMTHEGLKKVIQFAIIFYLLQKKKTHAWIWKHERLVAFPSSEFFYKNIGVTMLVGPWLK